jgi:hypothetical protein
MSPPLRVPFYNHSKRQLEQQGDLRLERHGHGNKYPRIVPGWAEVHESAKLEIAQSVSQSVLGTQSSHLWFVIDEQLFAELRSQC